METIDNQSLIDYQRIEKAIQFIDSNFQNQPSLKEIADAVNLSEFHFERMFSRWAGTTPQRFMRFLTKEYAKDLLQKNNNLEETAFESGLSSTGRLHDLFITFQAMSPGEYKRKGEGMTIDFGTYQSQFGEAFIAATTRGVLDISFLTDSSELDELMQLKNEFSSAKFIDNQALIGEMGSHIFQENHAVKPLNLLLRGTNFQIKVWEALLKLPVGKMACYEDIATMIQKPTAQRAVGSAIGSNHLAYIIPCHRVIQKVGTTGNYRWGTTRKKAMLAWEASHFNLE